MEFIFAVCPVTGRTNKILMTANAFKEQRFLSMIRKVLETDQGTISVCDGEATAEWNGAGEGESK